METMVLVAVVASLAALAAAAVAVLRHGPSQGALEKALRDELRAGREEAARAARELRDENARIASGLRDEVARSIGSVREGVEARLRDLQAANDRQLEAVRRTVDEKLHDTLEKRLGESFRTVSGQLEAVHKGLGEMQALATGVGDLKKVLTNVKTRGTWGEVQLGAILEQMLTPAQYDRNVATRRGSRDVVEFAVRLPGAGEGEAVHLPIDSKFPHEDYARLVDASEAGDAEAAARASTDLARAVRRAATDVRDKYLDPPHTTDFAILFVPTEGLFAELLRQAGLVEELQQKYRVVVAGPTTLAATLSSLRMGFRTLAIEQRAGEAWRVLAGAKQEFGRFADVLARVKKQLAAAGNALDETDRRTRAIERSLRQVEAAPEVEAGEPMDQLGGGALREDGAGRDPGDGAS